MQVFIPVVVLMTYLVVCYLILDREHLNLLFYISFVAAFIAGIYLCYLMDLSGVFVLLLPIVTNVLLLVFAAILRALLRPYDDNSTFTYNVDLLTGWDAKWVTARYGDGVVRYDYKGLVGKKIIAYYSETKNTPGLIVVCDGKNRREIGLIDTTQGLVYLSRYSEAARRGLNGNDPQVCPDPRKLFAKLPPQLFPTSGSLLDARTGTVLGTYDGDMIGAAAAFIALTSTFHTNTEFANYQVDWE